MLHTKAVTRMIGKWFCTTIKLKNQIKTSFSMRNIFFIICVVFVWILKVYSLIEKLALKGLLKIFGTQNLYFRM